MAIPKTMQAKYDEIAPLIIAFCEEKLSEDYKALCLRLLEKLCRKRPSPLLGGRSRTWAAGIVYAIGANNFIFDKSQEIHMTAGELASGFGLATSTAGNKASEIRDMFKMDYFNTEWQLPDLVAQNPIVWLLQTKEGFLFDVRQTPIDIQQQAFEMGLIPYVPGEPEEENICRITIVPGEKSNDS